MQNPLRRADFDLLLHLVDESIYRLTYFTNSVNSYV